jgi:hypothetical protein
MRKLKLLVLAVGFAFLFSQSGCGGDGGSSVGDGGTAAVTIRGNVLNGVHAKNRWYDRLLCKMNSPAYALDPNQVAKVMVFYQDGTYVVSEVTDEGNFSLQVDRDGPAGMIFVGAGNDFLGYLTLGDGVDTLPLNSIADSVGEIDLGILSSLGLIVEPAHNPLGNEIPLTPLDLKALAQCDDFFSSIVKNPDVDGNGIIDSLEGKDYFMELYYKFPGGRFGANLTPDLYDPISLEMYQIHVHRNIPPDDINCPDSINLTGPPGSVVSDPTSLEEMLVGSHCIHRLIVIPNPEPLLGGQYVFEYPDLTLTFNIPDQALITSHAVLILPTVTLNDDGTIQKISWIYQLADGSGEISNPASIIREMKIHLADLAHSPQGLYDSDYFSPQITEYHLSNLGLFWADVGTLGFVYRDIFGNDYFISWDM